MDQDIERLINHVSPAVLEERIRGIDRRLEDVEVEMRNLATKEDVRDLKKTVEKKDDRSNDWLKTIVGGTIAGVIVGIALYFLPAIAGPLHH